MKARGRSQQLFARAERLMPGGVNSPVRALGAVGGTPLFIARGEGPRVWDVDGNEYIDFVMSWGPLIHGHAFPPVVEAVTRAAARGTSFGAPTEAEVTLAGAVKASIPSIELVRFVNSGTEAAMSAIRLARAVTGRETIVKFAGNYHGHADMLLARAGSGSLTFGVPTSPGVPAGAAATTLVARFNDVDGLRSLVRRHANELAAIIVEPVAGNMGVVPPAPGFLEEIATLAHSAGALFLCDEVISGFRVALGGAQTRYSLRPDLTILGKIIGGGLPVGAYGGRQDIMRQVSPSGPVYQAGTLSGNPLSMAAGIANLAPLREPDFYERLDDTTERLASGLRRAAAEAGVAVCVQAITGMLTVFFRADDVRNLDDAEASDTTRFAVFYHAMLDRGVYLPPSQFEAWMLSAAHGPDTIDEALSAARDAFAEVAASGQ